MKLKEIISSIINEDLPTLKFHYSNYNNDPRPRVKALDLDYPGRKGQKTYGKRKDILGWNLNYFKNSRYAARAIDDIDSFAKLLGADKKEKYERIKKLFPEQAKYLRRYMKKHVKGLKMKKGWFWKSADYNDIDKENKVSF